MISIYSEGRVTTRVGGLGRRHEAMKEITKSPITAPIVIATILFVPPPPVVALEFAEVVVLAGVVGGTVGVEVADE